MKLKGRDYFLLTAGIALTLFHLWVMRPLPEVPHRIDLKLFIENLSSPGEGFSEWSSTGVDTARFPISREFKHYRMGPLGVRDNFFAAMTTIMHTAEGRYDFLISSDYFSGTETRIFLNGTPVIYHHGREIKGHASILLREGPQTLEITHSKGEGANYLSIYYSPPDSERFYYVGENSASTYFTPSSY